MNRIVYGGGGIRPDLKTDIEKPSAFINMLWKKGVFLSFSAQYIAKKANKMNVFFTFSTVF